MSAPVVSPKPDVDFELDWIMLRNQLDQEREKENYTPPYKDNFFVKLGLVATSLSFGYAVLNMNDTRKLYIGAGSRIACQLATILIFSAGYYSYTKTPEYSERKEKLYEKKTEKPLYD